MIHWIFLAVIAHLIGSFFMNGFVRSATSLYYFCIYRYMCQWNLDEISQVDGRIIKAAREQAIDKVKNSDYQKLLEELENGDLTS